MRFVGAAGDKRWSISERRTSTWSPKGHQSFRAALISVGQRPVGGEARPEDPEAEACNAVWRASAAVLHPARGIEDMRARSARRRAGRIEGGGGGAGLARATRCCQFPVTGRWWPGGPASPDAGRPGSLARASRSARQRPRDRECSGEWHHAPWASSCPTRLPPCGVSWPPLPTGAWEGRRQVIRVRRFRRGSSRRRLGYCGPWAHLAWGLVIAQPPRTGGARWGRPGPAPGPRIFAPSGKGAGRFHVRPDPAGTKAPAPTVGRSARRPGCRTRDKAGGPAISVAGRPTVPSTAKSSPPCAPARRSG